MADVQIAVIDQQNTEVTVAVPGIQGIQGQTGDVAVAQDGTAALPGIRFQNDTNTGIYRPGADQLAISTNGTGRLFVDASGNIAVGTSATTFYGGRFTIAGGALALASGNKAIFWSPADNGYGEILSPAQNVLAFNTSSTERLRITSAGLVGIGTSSPSDKLHVNGGDIRITDTFPSLLLEGTTGGQTWNFIEVSSGNLETRLNNSSVHVIDTSGRVGIGTTSPSLKLSVDGDVWFGNGAGVETGRLFNDAGVLHLRGSSNVTGLAFGTNGSEKARIDSSGRLLVGTSSSSAITTLVVQGHSSSTTANGIITLSRGTTAPGTFDFLGNIRFSDSGHVVAAEINARRDGGTWTSGSSQPTRLEFSTTADGASSPTERMRITSAGNVAINSGTGAGLVAPQTGFSVIGGADVSSATPGIITLGSNDNAVSANDVLGRIRFHSNDASTSMAGTVARIECIATSGFSGTAPTALAFFTNNGVADAETEKMRIKANGTINFSNVAVYADNTAALAGGLVAGDVYRKSDGTLMITY